MKINQSFIKKSSDVSSMSKSATQSSLIFLLAVVLLLLSVTATGQTTQPGLKAGDAAPDIAINKLLQAPEGAGTDRENLRGNVVVLEFWATWCAPCIAAMPHLNELADKFKDKPVRFIAITDENESIVAPFLKRRTIKSWVGLDTERSAMKSYFVKFYPTTVIIDRDGKIAAVTMPKSLTEEMLNRLLEGKPASMAEEKNDIPKPPVQKPAAENEVKPLFAISIKPAKPGAYGWSRGAGRLRGKMTLKTLLSLLNNIPATRIIGPSALDENCYEISASLAAGNKNDLELLLALAIETSFKLKVHREVREMEAFVLSAPKQSEIKLRPNPTERGHWSDDEGVMAASAAPFQALLDGIESVVKKPVFDETNLNGKYDWDIVFDGKNPESIIEAIRKDLGLELKRARKQIEVLVVEME